MAVPVPTALPSSELETDNRHETMQTWLIFITILTAVSITLRFWARALGKPGNRFWWDDWLALAAVVKLPLLRFGKLLLVNPPFDSRSSWLNCLFASPCFRMVLVATTMTYREKNSPSS